MVTEKYTNRCGTGYVLFATALFAILKLTGAITWDWLWVLFPLWGYFLLLAALGFLLGVITAIKEGK
jgi:hypothetical protein